MNRINIRELQNYESLQLGSIDSTVLSIDESIDCTYDSYEFMTRITIIRLNYSLFLSVFAQIVLNLLNIRFIAEAFKPIFPKFSPFLKEMTFDSPIIY